MIRCLPEIQFERASRAFLGNPSWERRIARVAGGAAARERANYKPHKAARAPGALIGCEGLPPCVTSGRGVGGCRSPGGTEAPGAGSRRPP